MCTVQWFSVFSELFNHHCHLISECVHPPKKPSTSQQLLVILPPEFLNFWQALLYFPLLGVCLRIYFQGFWESHMNRLRLYVVFCIKFQGLSIMSPNPRYVALCVSNSVFATSDAGMQPIFFSQFLVSVELDHFRALGCCE